ncbi:MAG: T9SS type A sorting domain-containing protein [Ignavibacteriales bacterium]|nr:T9SS type A sorting domain-containing protein [Ignavibacteriales bacterium]
MKGVRKPTGVEDEFNTQLSGEIKIYVSPNPFSGSTNVKYTIPVEGEVNITVYDIMGSEVYTNTTFTTKGET